MNVDRLEKLAADYEDKARTLRRAIELLTGQPAAADVKALPGKLAAAAKLRGAPRKPKKSELILSTAARIVAAGGPVRTPDIIARVRADHGVVLSNAHVWQTLKNQQWRTSGRTADAQWTAPPDAAATNGNGTAPTRHQDRHASTRRMVDLLAHVDATRPRTPADIRAALVADGWTDAAAVKAIRGVSMLLRRKYLRTKRGGYVTGKPYTPDLSV